MENKNLYFYFDELKEITSSKTRNSIIYLSDEKDRNPHIFPSIRAIIDGDKIRIEEATILNRRLGYEIEWGMVMETTGDVIYENTNTDFKEYCKKFLEEQKEIEKTENILKKTKSIFK